MTEQRETPFSHRMVTVADDGTIPTWVVTWTGDGAISKRTTIFIHYEDALGEYNWIMRSLKNAATWQKNKDKLRLEDGERVSWDELFEEPGIYNWEA